MASGFRPVSDEEVARIFECYRTAPIYPVTSKPSSNYVAKKMHVSRLLVNKLRDANDWEPRRLAILKQVQKKADEKRVRADVKKVDIYENLEKAGLNFQSAKVYKSKDGQVMSDLKVTDIISLGKHVEYLKGNASDRHDVNINGNPVKVIVELPDNGMNRKNGNSDD